MAAAYKELPLPPLFDPKNAADWGYRPDQQQTFVQAMAWAKAHGISGAAASKKKIAVVGIDNQKDFCFPKGTLFVGGRSGTGAIDDSARFAAFLYRNLGIITDVRMTFDTHFGFQIFLPSFWLDANGDNVSPHTLIEAKDVREGKYRVSPAAAAAIGAPYAWLCNEAQFYCDELERQGKYKLYIWPFHTMLGSEGHSLVGVIDEARMFLSFARGIQSHGEVKGGYPLAECYSVFGAEVRKRHDGKPSKAQKNVELIKTLVQNDYVIFGGQAASHCFKSSVGDFLTEIAVMDPDLIRKCYLLRDCTSSVVVPNPAGGYLADYTPETDAAFAKFAGEGMHVVNSTDPVASWPGIEL